MDKLIDNYARCYIDHMKTLGWENYGKNSAKWGIRGPGATIEDTVSDVMSDMNYEAWVLGPEWLEKYYDANRTKIRDAMTESITKCRGLM